MGALRDEVDRSYDQAFRLQSAELEVTHRCMCSCVHCYLVEREEDELTTAEAGRLFKELREEGVIFLAITGGEPFLRDDLPGMLELAGRERFIISILTTGVLVGAAEARMLARSGVRGVEMSLLGATADTHDSLMRHPGAFARLWEAVGHLQSAGIEVALKSTMLSANCGEFTAMREAARARGAAFSASRLLAPAVDGSMSPQDWAVSPEQAAVLDASLPPRVHPGDPGGEGGALLTCSAGRTTCGITPSGVVLPCVLLRRPLGSIRERSLFDIWHASPDPFLVQLRRLEPGDVRECSECPHRLRCVRCPGTAWTETGSLSACCPSARRAAFPGT